MKKALHHLNIEAGFHFLPFEINPDMSVGGEAIDRFFKLRHQCGQSKLLDYQENLVAVAASADVIIDFPKLTSLLQQR